MKTNYLAILACVVLNIVLGMAWYGIFADPWMAAVGHNEAELAAAPPTKYIVSMLTAAATAFLFSMILQRMNITTFKDSAMVGAAVGFMALCGNIVSNMFAMQTLTLSLIDGGFAFIQLTLIATVMGGWQKK